MMSQELAGCLLVAPSGLASVHFVKGHEAVSTLPDRSGKVKTPPLPCGLATPCLAPRAGCAGASWKMVDTSAGLAHCPEFHARPGTSRTQALPFGAGQ